MEQHEFKLETTFSDRSNLRWLAAAAAVVLLTGIALTIWTGIPQSLLPMTDESMAALIPLGIDGGEPVALKTVDQTVDGNTLKVTGTVENRALTDIRNLLVVIEATGVSKALARPVEAPVDPPDVPAREKATFDVTVEMDEQPANYKVRFKILNGPFLPHKDERPSALPAEPEKSSQ